MKLQEWKLGFVALPPHGLSSHWVVFGVFSVATLSQKLVLLGIVSTSLPAAAANLKMACQVRVRKVCALVVRQQVNWFIHAPQTEGSLVGLEIMRCYNLA